MGLSAAAMSSDAPRPDAWVCAADARVSALTQRTPNVRLRARATPRRRAAGVALAADRTPQLIPLAARPAPPVALSRVAYAQARRAGLVIDTSRVTPAPAAAHAAGVRSAPGTPRTPPASPWGQPRAWGSGTPRAPNARAAVLAHRPAVSVRTDTASPTRAPRATRAPRPARTLDELYDGAHTRFAAPLTVPVGLVNQGNSCFASAILQMLVYCRPLYNFLTELHAMLPQDLSNSTPLLEAIFRFYAEIPLVAHTPLLEMEIDPILPDYVYDAMRLHKRFDLFHLGHQEDAEEFFSLVLSTLHEEVLLAQQRAQRRLGAAHRHTPSAPQAPPPVADADEHVEAREVQRPTSPEQDEWLEVGQKGKTSLTRTAGTRDAASPISRIFDGKVRSVLHVPGSKTSIVLEPYRALPLDIQPASVRTLEDALRHLTVPEEISGVWSPGRGALVDATKQLCIEMLPPVLVLHLKRFVYDEVGGVQKSCKPIAYGHRLTIDPATMSAPLRMAGPPPEYSLFGVVYHHGRLATGGHYTAAVLRQDDSGWVHIDDTCARAVPAGEVLTGDLCNEGTPSPAYLLFYQRRAP